MASDLEAFSAAPVRHVDVGTKLAYRSFGQGPALALPGRTPGAPLNVLSMCFDPLRARPLIENWESVARHLLQRLARDHLLTGRASRPRSCASNWRVCRCRPKFVGSSRV
jgi:hypothetical protein